MTGAVTHTAVDPAKADALLETMRARRARRTPATAWSTSSSSRAAGRATPTPRASCTPDGEREYIVRARPQGSTLDTDLGQEFRVYSLLMDEPVPTPDVHGFEPAEDTPFGGPYFVMDRVAGHAPNVWRRRDRRALEEDWDGDRGLAGDLVDNLAGIHAIDADRAAEAATVRDFRQTIDHWAGVYEEMRLVPDPVVDEAYAWVRAREPEPVRPTLVHGDYRIGNCLTAGGRVTGILDWELCFVGDPRFDLGYMSLDYAAGKFTTPGSELLNATAERALVPRALRGALRQPRRPRGRAHVHRARRADAVRDHDHRRPRLPPRRSRRHPAGLGALRAAGAAAGRRRADGLVTANCVALGRGRGSGMPDGVIG